MHICMSYFVLVLYFMAMNIQSELLQTNPVNRKRVGFRSILSFSDLCRKSLMHCIFMDSPHLFDYPVTKGKRSHSLSSCNWQVMLFVTKQLLVITEVSQTICITIKLYENNIIKMNELCCYVVRSWGSAGFTDMVLGLNQLTVTGLK